MNVSETHAAYNFRVEDRGTLHLRIVSNHLPDNTESQTNRPQSQHSVTWKIEKSHNIINSIMQNKIDGGIINIMFYVFEEK
jgi:hypothetical protein